MDNRNNQVLYTPTQKAAPAVADLSSFYQTYQDKSVLVGVSSGTHTVNLSSIPSGIICIVTAIMAVDFGSAIDKISIRALISGNERIIISGVNLSAREGISFSGQIILDGGDYIKAIFEGCGAGDQLRLDASGYDVKRY